MDEELKVVYMGIELIVGHFRYACCEGFIAFPDRNNLTALVLDTFLVYKRTLIEFGCIFRETCVAQIGIEDRGTAFAEEAVTVVAYPAWFNRAALCARFTLMLGFWSFAFSPFDRGNIYRRSL
jgi:hypothetical protein